MHKKGARDKHGLVAEIQLGTGTSRWVQTTVSVDTFAGSDFSALSFFIENGYQQGSRSQPNMKWYLVSCWSGFVYAFSNEGQVETRTLMAASRATRALVQFSDQAIYACASHRRF